MYIKNHVQLTGRLGANPEERLLRDGSKLVRFSIAVAETYRNQAGEKITDVQWHAVTAWGQLADIALRILHKGMHVTVDGRLLKRSYIARDGVKRSTTEVVADELFVTQQSAA